MRGSDVGRSECVCTDAERLALLGVARAAVLAAAHAQPSPPLPDDLPARLYAPAGAFVSLHDARGRLRGCIGDVTPDGPLASIVARVAAAAATRDPRFPRLRAEEIGGLRVEVSVLSPMWRVTIAEIEPAIHGLCLEHGRHRAILLPQVAAGEGWDTETLLAHLCAKADVAPDAWRDPEAMLFAFTVERVEGEV
jgi:AmmeMemoRadiSam system protein A